MFRQLIMGLSVFLFFLFLSISIVSKDTYSFKFKDSKNYYPPFVVNVESLDSNFKSYSLCNQISFSQNAYQQCLYSVEGLRASIFRKIIIAIIDSGIDTDHYYFKGIISNKSKSFVDKSIDSEIYHGTHISGILVKNLLSLSLYFKTDIPFEILVLKTIEKTSSQDKKDREKYPYVAKASIVGKAVEYAIENGASIINISIFGESTSEDQIVSFKKAEKEGVPLIVAAGNLTSDLDIYPGYPCSIDISNIYCVGSISTKGELSITSNFGKAVKFYTLGNNILSATSKYSWGQLSGTSMATPKMTALMTYSRFKNIPLSYFYGNQYLTDPKNPQKIYINKIVSGFVGNVQVGKK